MDTLAVDNRTTSQRGRLRATTKIAPRPGPADPPHLEPPSLMMEDTAGNNMYGFGPLLSLPFARANKTEWKFKANLVGEKILNPAIYLCDECNLPILIYGRMIPCKHIFCFSCANKSSKSCPRCSDEIFKIEKCNLGTVFMCRTESCKRTYLSQRDLEAHIKHRHVRKADMSQR